MDSGSFGSELEGLEARLLDMGQLVQTQLKGALAALASGDPEVAQRVIDDDDLLDRAYVEVEQGILRALALRAPAAGDLRTVAAVLHVNAHLERMGDLCVNMARFARLTRNCPPVPEIQATLAEMGNHAEKLIQGALLAFARRDAVLAGTLPALDEPLDRLNQQIFGQIEQAAGDERTLEWASRMILVARYLERLGDHSVDIGEQVAFVVTGKVREFPPPKSERGRRPGDRPGTPFRRPARTT